MNTRSSQLELLRCSLQTLRAAVESVNAIQRTISVTGIQGSAPSEAVLVYEFGQNRGPVIVQNEDSPSASSSAGNPSFIGTDLLTFAEKPDSLDRYNSCPITWQTFGPGTKLRRVVRCGHYFERKALEDWLIMSDTCPICRCKVSEFIGDGQTKKAC